MSATISCERCHGSGHISEPGLLSDYAACPDCDANGYLEIPDQESQAKEPEASGGTAQCASPEVRVGVSGAGLTATSEHMDVTAGETAPILPCPFCGSTNIHDLPNFDWVACQDCGAQIEDGEPSARELWNRRAKSQTFAPAQSSRVLSRIKSLADAPDPYSPAPERLSEIMTICDEALASQPPAAPVEALIAAAREWVTERNPKDAAEKALFAAVFRAFPEDAHTRESCDCGGDCDECPPAAQVEAWLQECEATSTLTFPDGLRGARKKAMESHASMLPTGMGWKLSDSAKAEITEIDRNIREAPANIASHSRLSAESERQYSRDEIEGILASRWPSVFCKEGHHGTPNQFAKNLVAFFGSHPRAEMPSQPLAGGVLESDPALFDILNNALGTMHYHRLMSALNWNGYVITREPQPTSKSVKLCYVKRWRTLVELPEKYADEIVEALRPPQARSTQAPREGLAAELTAFHDACSMDSAGGDGQFRILCSSGSSDQARALRAVLREAATALSLTRPEFK